MESENAVATETVANDVTSHMDVVVDTGAAASDRDHVLPMSTGAHEDEGPSLPEIQEELRRLREENEALEARNESLEKESVRLEKRAEVMRSELDEIRPVAEAGGALVAPDCTGQRLSSFLL